MFQKKNGVEVARRDLSLKATRQGNGRLSYVSPEQRRQLLMAWLAECENGGKTHVRPQKVLLVGDGGVASVELGEILGVCPEAPLPRVLIKQQQQALDGAGGIAVMLRKSGLVPMVFCPSGTGMISTLQRRLLGREKLAHGTLRSGLPRTLLYTRLVFAGNHHISHFVNQELVAADSSRQVARSIAAIQRGLERASLLCIVGREEGGVDAEALSTVLAASKKWKVAVVYDDKAKELIYNSNIDVIKVNQDQIKRWFGMADESDETALKAVELVRAKSGARQVVYTRRTQGILVGGGNNGTPSATYLIRPEPRRMFDLVSVGDIVTTALAFSLAQEWPLLQAACFAATAAEFGLDRRYEKQFDLQVLIRSLIA